MAEAAPYPWEAKGSTITVVDNAVAVRYTSAGVELSAWVRGSGQPVVLLHGSGLATHASLTELTRDLAAVCRVITCDARGFGASVSRDPASHTWRQYALDVVALLDHLEIGAAVVGGYSLGAAIALVTALHHPGRVAGLILAQASFAGAELGLTPAQQRLWTRSRALLQEARAHGLKSALAATASSDDEAARISAVVDDHDEASLLAAHEGELQTAQPIPTLEVLQRVSVPTLLLPGDDDTHPLVVSSWYAQQMPHAMIGPSAAAPLTAQAEAIRELLEHVRG